MPIPLPAAYTWLLGVQDRPRLIDCALAFYGVAETPGPRNNPVLLAWAAELGLAKVYTDDTTQPWCGLFMAKVAKDAGKPVVNLPLWARSWLSFGEAASPPALGDVLVFERRDAAGHLIGGHVGLYVGEDDGHYHVLGGNEGDAVRIVPIPKAKCIGARRPVWKISQPAGVRPFHLAPTGAPADASLT